MLKKLLIANRGEIALRIIKTAKKMGIETFAVFSQIDANAQHVQLADHAFCIGPPPSQQSYLDQTKLINLCKEHNIDAIHPGYGFLSENAEFVNRCNKANIIFIGPPADAVLSMGNKSIAKGIMQKAGVPTTPGYQGEDQNEKILASEANKIGYPLLIKASSGGGGKGMRLVLDKKDFLNQLEAAKSEAKASFDNDEVLLEKYLHPSRHVEVQIFADQKGNAVYLFDRDCSIQRRHQKIIEEAPAPNLSDTLRKKMGETAVKSALAINYVGAGTVEFLLDQNNQFYFMEMNTRLQVEHPVTEMITGLDLVEWQLKIASGESLPLKQNQVKKNGHAIEARICAETPLKDFIPATGTLALLDFPQQSEHVRVDSGVIEGDAISPYYDPMIAKLIVWADTREQAITLLQEQLAQTYILGVNTNVAFISRVIQTQDFIKANIHTQFIEQHQAKLLKQDQTIADVVLALASIAELRHQKSVALKNAKQSTDKSSPWLIRDSWRSSMAYKHQLQFWHLEQKYLISVTENSDSFIIDYQERSIPVTAKWSDEIRLHAIINDEAIHCACIHKDDVIYIFYQGQLYSLNLLNVQMHQDETQAHDAHFISPMPATVVDVLVKAGDKVSAGAKLMVLEAMKMQHTITAPQAGIVNEVHFKKGDLLREGETLLDFEAG